MLAAWHKKLAHLSTRHIARELEDADLMPSGDKIFRAFTYQPPEAIKCVIVGQDPYPDYATGLAFSVEDGIGFPSSLINIFKEMKNDLGFEEPLSGNLEPWAEQGVLLLNSVLTTAKGVSRAHAGIGWEEYTDEVIRVLNRSKTSIVFMLWGKDAVEKKSIITNPKHLVILSTHPSPLSANNQNSKLEPFMGSRPFSRCNEHLKKNALEPIDWKL